MKKQERMHDEWEFILEEYFFNKPLRPASEWSYRKVLLTFTRFIGDSVTPAMVTQRDVLYWRRHLLKEKELSVNTWNNKVAHLRAVFNLGIKKGLLIFEDNPFNGTVVRSDSKKKRILTRPQLTRLYLVMQQFEQEEKEKTTRKKCALILPGSG